MLIAANQKLVAASDVLVSVVSRGVSFFIPALRMLAGTWKPPVWLRILVFLGRCLLQAIQRQIGWIVLLALLAYGGIEARPHVMKWWHGLTPDVVAPIQVMVATTRLQSPPATRIDLGENPRPLSIVFSRNVAPIAQINGVASGVSLTPSLAGTWNWVGADRLEFQPAEDWPIGQRYTVKLGELTLAPHIEIDGRQFEFTSPEFQARVENKQFYQDPVQATLRQAVFQLRFSHPVNTAELEKRLTLTFDETCGRGVLGVSLGGCVSEKYTVVYDKLRLLATLQSAPLAIPEKTRPLILQLAEGVTAQKGGSPSGNVRTSVQIPGLYSLAVQGVDASIVTGANDEPEHVFRINVSMPVHERELSRNVRAWLLPLQKEAGKAGSAADSEPAAPFDWAADPQAVNDEVLARAAQLALQAIPSEREVTDSVAFRMPQAEGGRHLLVRVAKGMKTPGGYQLGEAVQFVKKLNIFAAELKIMSEGSLLAMSGEKKLSILVRDLPGVRVSIGRLLPQQLQHLVTQTGGDFGHPEFYNRLQADNLVDRFEKEVPLDLPRGKAHYETVDFGDYLHKDMSDRRGVFLLKVEGFDPKAKDKTPGEPAPPEDEDQPRGYNDTQNDRGYPGTDDGDPRGGDSAAQVDQRLVLVTDLGVLAKKALDGSRDVFVQSIATGQPVANALVEVWGLNGTIIATNRTDATGRANLASVAAFKREKAPVVLVVRKDGDMSFLPLGRRDRVLDVSRFDIGGLRAAGVPNQMTAYVFSDRGIYRPGDSMHIAMLVKSGNWATSLVDLPLEVEVVDARGLSVRREKIKLGIGGAAEIVHTTQDSSPTGQYTVSVFLPREATSGSPDTQGLLLGSTTVRVQEFLPDRSKVVVQLTREAAEGWVPSKDMKAMVDVQNLFGTPAQSRKVEGTLTLSPAFPVFKGFADYSFFDPQRAKDTQTDDLGSVQTGNDGKAEFDLRLARFAAATYQVHVLAKAFEPEGGRSVSAEARTLVSDLPYLVGVKVDGDVFYVAKDDARTATFVAINSSARRIAAPGLQLQRLERKVLSVLVKQDNGLYRYESRKKEQVLEEKTVSIAAAGMAQVLKTELPGNFAYVLRNAEGLELNRVEYSVAGSANISRSLERNAELQLTLDKKDYEPGQDIEISVRAPYVGAGLITIERDKVYAHSWFKTDKTASYAQATSRPRATCTRTFTGANWPSPRRPGPLPPA